MTWARLDDQTARMVALRSAGRDAALLWYASLTECAAVDGNGYMPALLTEDTAHLFRLPKKAAAVLVEHGLWHDCETVKRCAECCDYPGSDVARVGRGDHFIHGWWRVLLDEAGKNDPIKRKREQRRKALNNNRELVARIRERDRDLCRYCGVATIDSSGPNKKSATVRTLDHVDPWGDNTYGNVVVACRRCNGVKKDRTPEEAGMTLRDPAGSGRNPAADPAGTTEDPAGNRAVPRDARETGTGRILAGSDREAAGSRSGVGPFDDPEPQDDERTPAA